MTGQYVYGRQEGVMLKDFKAMAELVKANPVKKRIVLCCAHDEHSLDAVYEAYKEGIVEPVFVGKEEEIRKICADEGFDFGDVTIYNDCLLYTSPSPRDRG